MKNYQVGCLDDFSTGRRLLRSDHHFNSNSKLVLFHGLTKFHSGKFKGVRVYKRHISVCKLFRNIVLTFVLLGFLIMLNSFIVSIFDTNLRDSPTSTQENGLQEKDDADIKEEKLPVHMYDRLLNFASTAISEKDYEQQGSSPLEEHKEEALAWTPCADRLGPFSGKEAKTNNGYIMVSANGGLNQQRVAICNAVAVAFLLNATLVIPTFLYSNVWKDPSQFGDIYQKEYFMDVMKDEVDIVNELPPLLKSLDIEAIGSLFTDADIVKEAKPIDYIEKILPILKRNGVVHFLGYGNRLGFDPLPENLQRLRCKCNFHALKFAPKIQEVGSLLVRRIRKYEASRSSLDQQLLGNFMPNRAEVAPSSSGYLALHLRFEEDMVAYSLCDFGGGENERNELHMYRESHYPLLIERLKKSKPISPEELRKLGKCPLTPEEAALVLAGLGFRHGTYIYLAGSQIYDGWSRMHPFTTLYPNVVTKETLLTPRELEPFRNFSSQLAALDFIACATADVFAMTDTGSQLASLVSGFRTYYGGGSAPTLRPNKKRLAAIFSENRTIEWSSFEDRIEEMIEEGQRVSVRGFGRSIYRHPRSPGCMCRSYQ